MYRVCGTKISWEGAQEVLTISRQRRRENQLTIVDKCIMNHAYNIFVHKAFKRTVWKKHYKSLLNYLYVIVSLKHNHLNADSFYVLSTQITFKIISTAATRMKVSKITRPLGIVVQMWKATGLTNAKLNSEIANV